MIHSSLLSLTSPPPHSSTLPPEPEPGWGKLLWIPYIILTVTLIVLACASFFHYHIKNRERYIEAMFKRKNNLHASPKKYRVTLNRRGIVGCVDLGHPYDPNRSNVSLSDAPTPPVYDTKQHDIFVVSSETSHKKKPTANGKVVKISDKPRSRTQCYDNEAYDHDSSVGSDKSLIGKSSDSSSKTDTEREPFSTKDAQRPSRETAYSINSAHGSVSRPQSRAETPSGLMFRSETPLSLTDRTDEGDRMSKPASRPVMGLRRATVAPLVEEPDSEADSDESLSDDEVLAI